jgi:hypothetical protein
MQLPNLVTPLALPELAVAFNAAWRALFGVSPSRNTVLTLLAQTAHQTGQWSTVHAFNIAAISSEEGDGRDFTFHRCRKMQPNGASVWVEPPAKGTRFRAYRTLLEGAIDHLAFLRKNYAAAWSPLVEGKPRAFVAALKGSGYFPEGEATYARSVGVLFGAYNARLPLLVPELELDALSERVQRLVAMTLHDLEPAAVPLLELVDDLEPVVHDTEPAPPPSLDDDDL